MNELVVSYNRNLSAVSAPITSGAGAVSDALKRLLQGDIKLLQADVPAIVTPGQKIERPLSYASTSSGFLVNAPMHSWADVGRDIRQTAGKPLSEQLFDAVASFKVLTSHISMHIDKSRREGLFQQLDELFDARYWDADDLPTGVGSFKTFLRTQLLINPEQPPGLGVAANGNIVAAWYADHDRLTLVCNSEDRVQFVLSAETDGVMESASGDTTVVRLLEALGPYRPSRWFSNG